MQNVIIYCLADDSQKARSTAAIIRNHGNKAMIRDGAVFKPEDAEQCDAVLVMPGCDEAIFQHFGEKASVFEEQDKSDKGEEPEIEPAADQEPENELDADQDAASKSNKARRK